MSAMKRHLENKIEKLLEEKRQNRAIIVDAFNNNEISEEHFKSEMNALELAEKTIKELDL
jgi:ribonuclease HIII